MNNIAFSKKINWLLLLSLWIYSCQAQIKTITLDGQKLSASLIYEEDFSGSLDDWQVEQMPGGKVFQKDGKMEIIDSMGCTVWNRQLFKQPLMIEYTATVIDEGGTLDRVSDLNCFWLATNPWSDDFFTSNRKGKFSQYDSLQLYYVGLGGHNNTKTRFRKYQGNGQKPLLPEHDLSDSEFLITPNKPVQIRIITYQGEVRYIRNGVTIFSYSDDDPYLTGYFGFRTVRNHMTIDDFKVYALSEN